MMQAHCSTSYLQDHEHRLPTSAQRPSTYSTRRRYERTHIASHTTVTSTNSAACTALREHSVMASPSPQQARQSTDSSTSYPQHPAPVPKHLLPKHLAVIMDGSNRWAQRHGLGMAKGHEAGTRPLHTLISCCRDWGIPALTVYAFSAENWDRSPLEVSVLMSLFESTLQQQLPWLQTQGVRLVVAGPRSSLPAGLLRQVERAEAATATNTALCLTVCLGYGGRQDIVAATRKLAADAKAGLIQPEDITEDIFQSCLSTSPAVAAVGAPDLLIRTSGEQRLSNFLLWELAYAELCFLPVLWPDFDQAAMSDALCDFAQRKRRYGRRPM